MISTKAKPQPRNTSGAATPPAESKHTAMNAIKVDAAWKIYQTRSGEEVEALRDVSMTAKPGEFHTIVGPSGCGKSTLLRAILGLIRLTKGDLLVDGEQVRGPRKDVGVVFQNSLLLPWLTVLDNVLLPVVVQKRKDHDYRSRAKDLLDLCGLKGFENKLPGELSGGMQQRVSIARALIHNPKYLLMDEPFGALDALTRENMQVELQRIWSESGSTVVLITHSISEAVFLGDFVHVMSPRPGRIVDLVESPFPRARSLDLLVDPGFGEVVQRVRSHFV